jgi:DNA-binding NarL/FixJ family response regulator
VKQLRILIADDHSLVRRGARTLLNSRHGWRVVGEATNGSEALRKALELKPDVALLDISMPELDGIEVARQLQEVSPTTKVVMLSMHDSDQLIQRAMDAGAQAYILKSDLTECLVKAVKGVSEGNRYLSPNVSKIVQEGILTATRRQSQGTGARVTPRELEIIHLLAEGKSNKEISTKLGITVRTAETHRAKIMHKLGLHSLAELIHYALDNQIVSR